MLEHAREGVALVAYVNPVAIGQLTVKGEDEAVRPVCLSPLVLFAVIVGQSGNESAGKACW